MEKDNQIEDVSITNIDKNNYEYNKINKLDEGRSDSNRSSKSFFQNEDELYKEKLKRMTKEAKRNGIVKKFHKMYKMLTGKSFIIQTNYDRQTVIEYHSKLYNLELLIFLISCLSILHGIVYYELSYKEDKEIDVKDYRILLYGLHFLTVCFFITLILKEKIFICYDIAHNLANPDENLINSKRYINILFYFLIFIYHPSPIFIGIELTEENEIDLPTIKYSLNSILIIALLLRSVFIIRPLVYMSLFMDPETGYCCKQHNFREGLMFSLKCQAKYSPLKLYAILMSLEWFILAYAVRLFERPANDTFDNYLNALWFIIVTMTTVGYGDLTAKTTGGRVVSIISSLSGVFLMSMAVVAFTSTLTLETHEYTMLAILKKTENIETEKKMASKIIATYLNIINMHSNGHNYSKIMGTYAITKPLKDLIRDFNQYVQKNSEQNSSEFVAIYNRLGFFVERQMHVIKRREEIHRRFEKVLDRIQSLQDRGIAIHKKYE